MRTRSGNSFFEYPLSRPFPSPVFTWIILTGGLVLAILFSFVAVASNAYELQSIYTTDPNITESNKRWFQKQPFSWLSRMETKCQPALITVGSQYLTSSRGFVHTLDSLRRGDYNTNDYEVLSSTAYKNVTLRDCEVSEIVISLTRRDNSHQAKNFWAWGATTARATTSCTIQSAGQAVFANFGVELLPVEQAPRIIESFLIQNATGNVNMWYGIQIAMSWYGLIATGMGWSVPESQVGSSWGAGSVTLTRNANESDYKKRTFFSADITISNDAGGLSYMHAQDGPRNNTVQDWSDQWDEGRYKLPNISISVDAFGKSFYSLLLSDFGVSNNSNAISTTDGIKYLQSIVDTDLSGATDGDNKGTIVQRYKADQRPETPRLNTPAQTTLFAQYLCSAPRSKGGVSIFFGVLLADIVFLSACWSIFVWIATTYVVPRLPSPGNTCQNYLAGAGSSNAVTSDRTAEMESQELLPIATNDRLSTRSVDPLIRQHSEVV
ncbi:hypothetical protein Slin15195_G031490 [Septoria linicola]|uniref:Uncharacterized protein n=1 Tax=Septoria linicola TaxID=215465 RepID=A0A9Q9EGC2_9PEZI|nr:hypothetical protein Slin14017_G030510 [Septoria linicola]USW49830.1 hypothetical protein Slin15195_G031490 [Septoria linicola]